MINILIGLLFLSFFSFLSCSEKLTPRSAPIENGVPATVNDQRSGDNEVSVTVDREGLETFWGELLNDPSDIKLFLEMEKLDDKNQFKGDLTISFIDSGSLNEAHFSSGTTDRDTVYNSWFERGDEPFFHMIFEDAPCVNEHSTAWASQSENCVGGLVLVIDRIIDLGDGDGPLNEVGGSIWYKNFKATKAAHPPTRCWLVSIGPYDCRPWVSTSHSSTVEPDSDSGYKKFVEFFGFRVSELFGDDFSVLDNLASNNKALTQTRSLASVSKKNTSITPRYWYFISFFICLFLIIGLVFTYLIRRSK